MMILYGSLYGYLPGLGLRVGGCRCRSCCFVKGLFASATRTCVSVLHHVCTCVCVCVCVCDARFLVVFLFFRGGGFAASSCFFFLPFLFVLSCFFFCGFAASSCFFFLTFLFVLSCFFFASARAAYVARAGPAEALATFAISFSSTRQLTFMYLATIYGRICGSIYGRICGSIYGLICGSIYGSICGIIYDNDIWGHI